MSGDKGDGTPGAVSISFLEDAESWQLSSHFFPSKVGGRPSWLALKHLPSGLTCDQCSKPLTFLLQIYSPLGDRPDCFHRTIFLFFCKNNACYATGKTPTFKAFRSQLGRSNPYYPSSPPDYNISWDGLRAKLKARKIAHVSSFSSVCAACGCPGGQRCAKCRQASYCCREHQVLDWKARHKKECKEVAENAAAYEPMLIFARNEAVLPEFALSEPQEEEEEEASDSESDSEEEEEEEGEEKEKKLPVVSGDLASLPDEELEAFARKETAEDKHFRHFKKMIAKAPDQIIRYQRNGRPLWVSLQHRMEAAPACELCGADRQFEFQVMPQLLCSLGLDLKDACSPDWGSLFVFSCSASCGTKETIEYAEELVWKQDFVQ